MEPEPPGRMRMPCQHRCARTSFAARARFRSEEESAAELGCYQQAHPKARRRLRGAIETAVGYEVDGLPMVNLRLIGD